MTKDKTRKTCFYFVRTVHLAISAVCAVKLEKRHTKINPESIINQNENNQKQATK